MSGGDPTTNSDGDPDDTSDSESTDSPGERSAPLADLAADVDARRERGGAELFEQAFAEQPYEAIDEESVWDEDDEGGESEFGAIGEVIESGEKTYVVSKRNFCERCRFFSEPPEVHCTHEGTEIREFVDMDHVRLYSCPIVEERGLGGERPAE